MSSASEASIKQQINYFIQAEEGLLGQYRQLRRAPTDVSGQLIADGLAEGARAIVSDIFSSAKVGRYAKGYAKKYLRNDNKRALATQEGNLDVQHQHVVQNAVGFLQSVSENKPRVREPNSQSLIAKINKAQGLSRLETRINRTILALKKIAAKPLAYNHEIAARNIEQPLPKPKLTVRFPRMANILTEVTGLEPKLRRHIRNGMQKAYGADWQARIKEKFGSSYARWESISHKRGGSDVMDGTQFGDLVNIINQFDVLRAGPLSTKEAQLALTIVQSERSILVHPLEDLKEDIDEPRYKRTSMAVLSLTSIL
jgi:hypothetical protein